MPAVPGEPGSALRIRKDGEATPPDSSFRHKLPHDPNRPVSRGACRDELHRTASPCVSVFLPKPRPSKVVLPWCPLLPPIWCCVATRYSSRRAPARRAASPTRPTRKAGITVVPDAAALYEAGELIVKVKEPIAGDLALLKKHHLLFCYLHLAAEPELTQSPARYRPDRRGVRVGRRERQPAAAAADVGDRRPHRHPDRHHAAASSAGRQGQAAGRHGLDPARQGGRARRRCRRQGRRLAGRGGRRPRGGVRQAPGSPGRDDGAGRRTSPRCTRTSRRWPRKCAMPTWWSVPC